MPVGAVPSRLEATYWVYAVLWSNFGSHGLYIIQARA